MATLQQHREVSFKSRVWNQKKGRVIHLGTRGGLNSNLEFEFKRNSTTRVQTSNINLKSKRKDHVYKLMIKHGAKTTLAWINLKTQT